jgi:hypothetical protein
MGPREYFAQPDLIRQAAERAAGGNNADGFAVERRLQCGFVRDIFNPFRPVSINPAWLTPTVTALAIAAYEECVLPAGELDPARLAVLADALEEAGCDKDEILTHLRSPGPHIRGCWPVDALLGKA